MPPELSSTPSEFVVKARMVGKRVDAYLASRYPDFSRSIIQKVIDAKAVHINGLPPKASYKVREGDLVRIWLPELSDEPPAAEDIPLRIVYEDAAFTVVDKPPGLVTHPAKGNWTGTLVNALQFHFDALSTVGGEHRPGIVHRLDRDTSGLLIVAKDDKAHRELASQFEARTIRKEYLALVYGTPSRGQRLHREAARPPPDQPREDRHPIPRRGRQGGDHLLRGPRAVPWASPWSAASRRPAGPTRSASTSPTSATRSSPTRRTRAAPPSPSATSSAPTTPTPPPSSSAARPSTPTPSTSSTPLTGQPIQFQSPLPDDIAGTLAALRAHRS